MSKIKNKIYNMFKDNSARKDTAKYIYRLTALFGYLTKRHRSRLYIRIPYVGLSLLTSFAMLEVWTLVICIVLIFAGVDISVICKNGSATDGIVDITMLHIYMYVVPAYLIFMFTPISIKDSISSKLLSITAKIISKIGAGEIEIQ